MSKKGWMQRKKKEARDNLKRELLEYGGIYCAAYELTISGLPKPYRFNNTVWAPNEDNALDQIQENVRAIAADIRISNGLTPEAHVDANMKAGGLVHETCHCEEVAGGTWRATSIEGTQATGSDEQAARYALMYVILERMVSQSKVRRALEKALAVAKKEQEA